MKKIEVRYFASLRELAGTDRETLTVDSATYGDLYDKLAGKYKFPLPRGMVQVAVNDEFSDLKLPILDGARVVFIPPVAGG